MDGRPQNEVELNAQLAETIGSAVEQMLGMTGFSEANNMMIDQMARNGGQPPVQASGGEERPEATPAVSGQPAPVTSAAPTAVPPGLNFDQYKDANGKYLGKYNTVDEFVKGIGHAMSMTKSTLAQNDDLNRRLAEQARELEALRVRPSAPTPGVVHADSHEEAGSPPSRMANPKLAEALASLAEGNLDGEGLVKLVDVLSEHAASAAREAAREEQRERDRVAQATQDRWSKVDEFMTGKYPDSMNFTNEMGLFTKTNPQIGAVVTALIEKDLHEQAMEYAWLQFSSEHGLNGKPAPAPFVPAPATPENVAKEIKGDAADQVRREAVEAARKDAGILGTGVGNHGVHENPDLGPTPGEMDEATALMRAGHGQKWRSLVFKDILNHPLFN
jgi:hypothetical protein